jgi:Holliday junction resolvase RusA-like endonuclease
MLRARPAGWPLNGEYVLDVGFWFGDRRRRDVDNCLKSIMDAGNGVLWADDSQVRRLGAGRELDAARPRAEIWVEVVG